MTLAIGTEPSADWRRSARRRLMEQVRHREDRSRERHTAANPLRGVAADAAAVSDLVRTVDGPVVLAAHSYGGMVMSNVDADASEIVGLVYANAFAPEPGENCFQLAAMFPGSLLGEETARPVSRSDGTTDLYVAPDSFHHVFCQDVPAAGRTDVRDATPRHPGGAGRTVR